MSEPIKNAERSQFQVWDGWFEKRARPEFAPVVLPFAGQPIMYVEVGTWAGASAEFVARNVLTHPQARGVSIDPYPVSRRHPKAEIGAIRKRAHTRIAETKVRWKWIEKPSVEALRNIEGLLKGRAIDLLYLDGDHHAHTVIQEFALAWPHLRVGSVVIFDDFTTRFHKRHPHVAAAYAAIVQSWGNKVQPVLPDEQHRWQRALKVVSK